MFKKDFKIAFSSRGFVVYDIAEGVNQPGGMTFCVNKTLFFVKENGSM